MQYQKMINLLNDTTNQLTKVRTTNWVEINVYSKGSNYKHYDSNTAAASAAINTTNKTVTFKSCAPFTHCIPKWIIHE